MLSFWLSFFIWMCGDGRFADKLSWSRREKAHPSAEAIDAKRRLACGEGGGPEPCATTPVVCMASERRHWAKLTNF